MESFELDKNNTMYRRKCLRHYERTYEPNFEKIDSSPIRDENENYENIKFRKAILDLIQKLRVKIEAGEVFFADGNY